MLQALSLYKSSPDYCIRPMSYVNGGVNTFTQNINIDYNSGFVYCGVKRSLIPLETSKWVHTVYSNIRSFARLFP